MYYSSDNVGIPHRFAYIKRNDLRPRFSVESRVIVVIDDPSENICEDRPAGERGVDVLLTDIALPDGMDGYRLASEARIQAPNVKVIYMSGHTGESLSGNKSSNSRDPLLHKPFRRTDLALELRKVLD